ncbi:MAG: hypothetical protein QXO97_08820 [Candidatus Nezhaarchaeales archaeon]
MQSECVALIVWTWLSGGGYLHEVKSPRTVASDIQIGRPVN